MDGLYKIKDGFALIDISSEVYSKEVIFQASYVLLEEFYFLIDLKDSRFLIQLKPKNKDEDLEMAALKFLDELIEAKNYIDQIQRTGDLRTIILERALLTQEIIDEAEIEGSKENK